MYIHKSSQKKKDNPSLIERNQAFFCTINGPYEMNIENYGSLLDYSSRKVVLHAARSILTVDGEDLLIDYFTDIDMKISGKIFSVHIKERL